LSKKTTALLLTLAAVSMGSITGCGGSDDSSSDSSSDTASTTTEAPTKAEFVTQANAVCKSAIDKVSDSSTDLGENAPDEELVQFIKDEYIPTIKDELSQLQELTPPEGDEDSWDEILTAFDDGISGVEDDPEAAVAGNENPLADASEKAKAYGLKICGNN